MSNASILVVEDEKPAAAYLRLLLEEEGYRVRTAGNGIEALVALEEESFDLMLSDLRMPKMGGIELAAHVQQRWNGLPVIVITADSDVSDVVEAMQMGAINYLVKPAAPPVVLTAVTKALAVRPPISQAAGRMPEIIGTSRDIVEVRHLVALAARSDVHVLITGETGTGKELVATAIHRTSSLTEGPFVAHNCAIQPRDLFESEFFGHRKGSFTGADREHLGLLTQADGGVLFLDELETLELVHQAKLLRVLDDGLVRPVGAEEAHQVSVRFLAATNIDPHAMMESKGLREDLYYRLRGFEISIPPLRDRREDIPLLGAHFAGEGVSFVPEAMDALTRAPWPGNVRQLRNVVRSARAIATGGRIAVRHLALDRAPRGVSPAQAGGFAGAQGATLREIERNAITKTLKDCAGNRSLASQVLGIDRSTLRRKMKEFGIKA